MLTTKCYVRRSCWWCIVRADVCAMPGSVGIHKVDAWDGFFSAWGYTLPIEGCTTRAQRVAKAKQLGYRVRRLYVKDDRPRRSKSC